MAIKTGLVVDIETFNKSRELDALIDRYRSMEAPTEASAPVLVPGHSQ